MNIYDIAREAGVSIATISRVINGKPVVSRKTKERVECILQKYNYTPNEIARGLVVNSIRTIGVMTIDIRDLYYANVAYTVEQELSKLGYNVFLCNTGEDTEEKIKYMRSLMQKKVDGIILIGSVFKDENLSKSIIEIAGEIPVVMVNGYEEHENIYSIICDDASGISAAVDYLTGKGRKALVYFQDTDTYSARSKVEGFKLGMQKNGMNTDKNTMIKVKKGMDGGYEGIEKLLSHKSQFDAVICGDDITAIGVMKCLKKHGVKIPEDVSVIGFNNSVLALCSDPALTSVDSKMNVMGMQAVAVFSKVMDGEKVQQKMVIKPELFIRDSS